MLEGVLPLLAELRERAAEVEVNGVEESVLTRLHDVGFFAMMQPVAYGGLESSPEDFYEIVRELAAACPSTGWVAALLGAHPWHLALFDELAQQEVWRADPRAILAAAYAPGGLLEPATDGYRLTGRWQFCTGVHHASWVLLGALLLGEQGDPEDFVVALLPSTDYAIEESWDAVGLRGIGADDVVVQSVHVPAYRTFGSPGRTRQKDPSYAARLAPLYRLPYPTIFTHAVTVPLIGAAEGAYAAYLAGAVEVAPEAQVAASDIRVSWLQLQANIRELMSYAHDNSQPAVEAVVRSRRDQVRASERAAYAIDRVLGAAGPEALERGHPIQRAWRDVHAGRTHGANDTEQVLSVFGRWAYGLSVDDRWW